MIHIIKKKITLWPFSHNGPSINDVTSSVGPKPLFWFRSDTKTEFEAKLYFYKLENRN